MTFVVSWSMGSGQLESQWQWMDGQGCRSWRPRGGIQRFVDRPDPSVLVVGGCYVFCCKGILVGRNITGCRMENTWTYMKNTWCMLHRWHMHHHLFLESMFRRWNTLLLAMSCVLMDWMPIPLQCWPGCCCFLRSWRSWAAWLRAMQSESCLMSCGASQQHKLRNHLSGWLQYWY